MPGHMMISITAQDLQSRVLVVNYLNGWAQTYVIGDSPLCMQAYITATAVLRCPQDGKVLFYGKVSPMLFDDSNSLVLSKSD